MDNKKRIDKISQLDVEEISELLRTHTEEDRAYAGKMAQEITDLVFHRRIYIRGLIEFSNYCKNNCIYCGIRRDNRNLCRYRLTPEQILSCAERGYQLGFRTFVLQGGEDGHFSDNLMEELIRSMKSRWPDSAVTLSLGERSYESYRRLKDAGADRYLLRHETANPEHYRKLHPDEMSYDNRMRCLKDLKELGYQTGCGMMIGSPYQTFRNLAEDLILIREFQPEMVGTGPFLPHKDTPFKNEKPGGTEMTLFILSLIRIILPEVLLPATTALGSATEDGRILGILAGANVLMPNLSPVDTREKYTLYDGKAGLHDEAQEVLESMGSKLQKMGYEISESRGDYGARD